MKPRVLLLLLAAALLGTLLLGSMGFEIEHAGGAVMTAEPAARGAPVLVRLLLGIAS